MELLNTMADKVFTEAGLVAFLLFWWGIYLLLDNRAVKRENSTLHDRIYNMGIEQTKVMASMNNILDKISDTLTAKFNKE